MKRERVNNAGIFILGAGIRVFILVVHGLAKSLGVGFLNV